MKKIFSILILTGLLAPVSIFSEAVSSKAYHKRIELLTYLRNIESIVKNYRGKNKDGKEADHNAKPGTEGERVKKYMEIKKLYQEGLIYYFEENYVNAYRRFLEAQIGMEQLLEETTQMYIEKTEEIMKSAIEKKDESNPEDKNLVDISVEYSNISKIREDQKQDRESPFTQRMYNPKEYHYVINKYAIETNMALGYKFLGMAKEARNAALRVEKTLEKHQKLEPTHRKYRIEKYFATIMRCRDARANAMNIFKLKYPYDLDYLQKNEKYMIENETMNYDQNPYVNIQKISPVFDIRIPDKYRKDATDVLGRVYEEEVNTRIHLKWDKKLRKTLTGDDKPYQEKSSQPAPAPDNKQPATPK